MNPHVQLVTFSLTSSTPCIGILCVIEHIHRNCLIMVSQCHIILQNSEVTVFYDIRPASTEHLLIVPNCHVGNPKLLKKEDLPMGKYVIVDVGWIF